MNLNGFQRLWVVAAALWMLPVLVVTYTNWPQFEDALNAQMANSDDERIFLRLPAAQDLKLTNGLILKVPADWQEAEVEAWIAKYRAPARQIVQDKRVESVMWAAIAWVVPLVGVYVLGAAIAWVRLGFARTAGATKRRPARSPRRRSE